MHFNSSLVSSHRSSFLTSILPSGFNSSLVSSHSPVQCLPYYHHISSSLVSSHSQVPSLPYYNHVSTVPKFPVTLQYPHFHTGFHSSSVPSHPLVPSIPSGLFGPHPLPLLLVSSCGHQLLVSVLPECYEKVWSLYTLTLLHVAATPQHCAKSFFRSC